MRKREEGRDKEAKEKNRLVNIRLQIKKLQIRKYETDHITTTFTSIFSINACTNE